MEDDPEGARMGSIESSHAEGENVVGETAAQRFKREVEFKRRFIGKTPDQTVGGEQEEFEEFHVPGKRNNRNGQNNEDDRGDARSLSFRHMLTYGANSRAKRAD